MLTTMLILVKKPSNDEIYKAIDELKPIGEKFEMSKTISD